MLCPDHPHELGRVGETMEKLLRSCAGQSTLEYALVLFAFMASIAAFGAVLAFLQNPATFSAVMEGSAHVFTGSDLLGTAQDLAVF